MKRFILATAFLTVLPLSAQQPVSVSNISASPVLPSRQLWELALPNGAGPKLAGKEEIYLHVSGALERLNIASGKIEWTLEQDVLPLYEEAGTLFATTADLQFMAIEGSSGKILWTTQLQAEGKGAFGKGNITVKNVPITRPVLAGNIVLVGTAGASLFKGRTGKLYALDSTKGQILWTFDAEDGVENSPIVSKDRVFFGGIAACYAVDLKTGKQVWKASLRSDNQWSCLLAGETILVSSGHFGGEKSPYGGTLYCLDAVDGHERWKFDIGGPSYVRVSEGIVLGIEWGFFGGTRLSAVKLADGSKAWEFKEKSRSAPLALDGKVIYSTKDNKVMVIDLVNGKSLASITPSADLDMGYFSAYLDPRLFGGRPMITSWDKRKGQTILQIIDPAKGGFVQELRLDGRLVDAPIKVENRTVMMLKSNNGLVLKVME